MPAGDAAGCLQARGLSRPCTGTAFRCGRSSLPSCPSCLVSSPPPGAPAAPAPGPLFTAISPLLSSSASPLLHGRFHMLLQPCFRVCHLLSYFLFPKAFFLFLVIPFLKHPVLILGMSDFQSPNPKVVVKCFPPVIVLFLPNCFSLFPFGFLSVAPGCVACPSTGCPSAFLGPAFSAPLPQEAPGGPRAGGSACRLLGAEGKARPPSCCDTQWRFQREPWERLSCHVSDQYPPHSEACPGPELRLLA